MSLSGTKPYLCMQPSEELQLKICFRVALPGFDMPRSTASESMPMTTTCQFPQPCPLSNASPAGPNVNVLSRSGRRFVFSPRKSAGWYRILVFERRTTRRGNKITLNELPESGANIRRRGEDVTPGTIVVSKGTTLDARQVAILQHRDHTHPSDTSLKGRNSVERQ